VGRPGSTSSLQHVEALGGPRVLLVDGLGQTPPYDAEVCRALREAGCRAWLWAARRPEVEQPPAEGQIEPRLIRMASMVFRSTPLRSAARGLAYLISLQYLPRLARAYDIVHIQWLPLLPWTALELAVLRRLRRLGCPLVFTAHNALPHDRISSKILKRYATAYGLCDAILVHGDVIREQLISALGCTPRRITVVPCGPMLYSVSEPRGPSRRLATDREHKGPIVLQFGVIRPYKGCDVLLSAVPELARAVPDVQVVIVGRPLGGMDLELSALRTSLGIQDNCCLRFGYVPDRELTGLIDSAAVVVFPYRDASQSAAVISAMSRGKVVVASAVGCIPEVIRDEVDGFLVGPGDPKALSATITRALSSAQRLTIGENARRRIFRDFSWNEHARRAAVVYRELLRARWGIPESPAR
jgi:glycosyltransferase involved in cell wall biosynthesis